MKVLALKSFIGYWKGKKYRVSEGDEFDQPTGVKWHQSGLTVPIRAKRRTATRKPKEKATSTRRSTKDK